MTASHRHRSPSRPELVGGVQILLACRDDDSGRAAQAARLASALRLEVVRALAAGREAPQRAPRVLLGAAMAEARAGDIVWAGALGADLAAPLAVCAGVDHRSVVGPSAARAVLESGGGEAPVLADALLLLAEAASLSHEGPRDGVALLADLDSVDERIRPLDLDGDPLEAARRLASCEAIVASTADGVAIADALGVPVHLVRDASTVRAELDELAIATGRGRTALALDVATALSRAPLRAPVADLEALRRSFPLDAWARPLVSIVVPTSDVDTWIDESLYSLRTQEIEDLEVIVVDDRSGDGTVRLARAAAAQDRRIRVLAGAVEGGGSARNLGASLARGRYIGFADGDDLVPSGAYRALLDSAEASGSDLVIGRFSKFSASKTWDPTRTWRAFAERQSSTTLVEEPSIIRGRACWNKLYRADFYREARIEFPDVPRSNDIVPVVTAYVRARSIDIVRDRVYLYRERPGDSSMTARAGQLLGLRSYLTQECRCLELVRGTGDAALLAEYTRMIVQSDGWVLLTRVLRSLSEESADHEAAIAARMRELLAGLDQQVLAAMPLERSTVYALVAAGRLRTAAAALAVDSLLDAGRAIGGLAAIRDASDELAAADAHPRLHSALALAAARVSLASIGAGERSAADAVEAVAAIARRGAGVEDDPRMGVVLRASLAGEASVLEHLSALGSGEIAAQVVRRRRGGASIEGVAPLRALGARFVLEARRDGGGAAELAQLEVVERDGGAGWRVEVPGGGLAEGIWRLQLRPAEHGEESDFVARLRWASEPYAEAFPRTDRIAVHGHVAERSELVLRSAPRAARRAARRIVRQMGPGVQRAVASALIAAKRARTRAQSRSTSEA